MRAQLVLALLVLLAAGIIAGGLYYQSHQRMQTADRQIGLSLALIDQGNYPRAISGLTQVLDEYPGLALPRRIEAMRHLASAYTRSASPEQAVRVYDRLIRETLERAGERNDETEKHVLSARIAIAELVWDSDPDLAASHAETVRNSGARDPGVMSTAMLYLGLAAHRKGEEPLAKEYLGKVIADYPESTAAERARDAIGDMNLAVLYSPSVDNPWSELYEIKRGDTLFDIARAHGTTVDFLQKVNNLGRTLRPGVHIKVPTVRFQVVVHRSRFALDVLTEDGQFVKRYPVAIGEIREKTRPGHYLINHVEKGPRWTDPRSGRVLTADHPEYPLGSVWLGLGTPDNFRGRTGLGIHGTNEPESIGTEASLGCVRMLNEDVEQLHELVVPGAKVEIRE